MNQSVRNKGTLQCLHLPITIFDYVKYLRGMFDNHDPQQWEYLTPHLC